jgi:hypothetical protein
MSTKPKPQPPRPYPQSLVLLRPRKLVYPRDPEVHLQNQPRPVVPIPDCPPGLKPTLRQEQFLKSRNRWDPELTRQQALGLISDIRGEDEYLTRLIERRARGEA